jgi:indole-3-glycerol phosphate synthase
MPVGAGTPDFHSRRAAGSRARSQHARSARSEQVLRDEISRLPAPPAPRFTDAAFHLIAEVKRRSPSAGELAQATLVPAGQARAYALGGAIAVSVLTEPHEFNGDLADLTDIARALPGMAVMRKDFLVDAYQVLEARAAGAAGVLLIAAMLEPEQFAAMLGTVLDLGMFALVEAFDREDLARCVPAVRAVAASERGRGRVLLGVNCRSLRTLQVDFRRFADLAPHLPADVPWVAESGIETPEHAAEVARLGYRTALVGSALMRSGDPVAATQALLAAGRRALGQP